MLRESIDAPHLYTFVERVDIPRDRPETVEIRWVLRILVNNIAYQGNGSLSADKEVMESLAVQIKELLLRLSNKGQDFDLEQRSNLSLVLYGGP